MPLTQSGARIIDTARKTWRSRLGVALNRLRTASGPAKAAVEVRIAPRVQFVHDAAGQPEDQHIDLREGPLWSSDLYGAADG